MKKIFLIIASGLFAVSAFAQPKQIQNRHEFSIWVAGGISTLHSDLATGENELFKDMSGLGGYAGLGYNYFFTYNWSLGIGAEFSLLRSTIKLPLVSDQYMTPDGFGGLINLRTEGQNFKEEQTAYYINIPLMAKYQVDICSKGHKFYVGFGPKIGIPVMDPEYKTTGTLNTSALYLNAQGQPTTTDWDGDPPFGQSSLDEVKGNFDLGVNFIAAVETGVKWRFNDALSLYTGIYLDYGLNDIRTGDDYEQSKNFYAYNERNETLTPNSVLYSNYNSESLVNRVNSLSTGIKVQFTFGIKPFEKKQKAAKEENPAVATVAKAETAPCNNVTSEQMEDIMSRNTQELIEAQNRELQEIKDLLKKEDLELGSAITGFDLDKKQILTGMHPELDKKVELMKQYPNINIVLEGHTDEQGSDQYNYELGLERANAAKTYMVSKGINENRMKVSSRGKTQPKVSGTDLDSRRLNRRVEFLFQ